ncbi:MAG TPA: DUF2182 domain-containing protein [Reyranella sp.]|nr:DUF2182 domain-containing protein [Reyranella sp.]
MRLGEATPDPSRQGRRTGRPRAAPGRPRLILIFATIDRRRRARAQPYAPTALFAAGYLVAWVGFSVAATLAQWGLER